MIVDGRALPGSPNHGGDAKAPLGIGIEEMPRISILRGLLGPFGQKILLGKEAPERGRTGLDKAPVAKTLLGDGFDFLGQARDGPCGGGFNQKRDSFDSEKLQPEIIGAYVDGDVEEKNPLKRGRLSTSAK
jgi:hypothetical protein